MWAKLKWRQNGALWTGSIGLRIGTLRAPVKAVMNFRVPYNFIKFSSNCTVLKKGSAHVVI
jgi:hypothetical protein